MSWHEFDFPKLHIPRVLYSSTSYERRNPLVKSIRDLAHDGRNARTGGGQNGTEKAQQGTTLKQAGQADLMRFVEEVRRLQRAKERLCLGDFGPLLCQ